MKNLPFNVSAPFLKLKSKSFWYKKCVFLTHKRSNLFPSTNSFSKALQTTQSFYKCTPPNKKAGKHLLAAQVLLQQRTHIYLSLPGKYTLIKPKFNIFFSSCFKFLPSQTLLLVTHDRAARFLGNYYLEKFLLNFRSSSLKYKYKAYTPSKSLFRPVYFQHLRGCLQTKFFKLRVFSRFFSKVQKRINFFQFNSFFKKLV